MNRDKNVEYGVKLRLEKGGILRLNRFPRGAQVACLSGRLWLTLDRDRDDHLLEGGGWFRSDRSRRRLIIYAVRDSELLLLKAEAARILRPLLSAP